MIPIEIYYEHLKIINGIKFTPREIDIISCIVNGRSAKTIPSLLSIAPKTASVHIENIRAKAECSSRESIIDFIEKSSMHSLIKNEYYSSMLLQNCFEQCLKEVSKIISAQKLSCVLVYDKQERNGKNFFPQNIEQSLKLAGFRVDANPKNIDIQQTNHILYVVPAVGQSAEISTEATKWISFIENSTLPVEKLICLLLEGQEYEKNIKNLDAVKYVKFSKSQNYYYSFFEVLKLLFPDKRLAQIFSDFKKQVDLNYQIKKNTSIPLSPASEFIKKDGILALISSFILSAFVTKKKELLIGTVFFLGIFLSYNLLIKNIGKVGENEKVQEHSIRSDFIIPTQSTFLNRSELIAEIDSKFKGAAGIQSIALVGIGGAGKTTLARQYAQQQQANVVWEMNAETQSHLNTSFENLGSALSIMDKDKKELQALQDIKDPQKREEKLIQFVKTHLRTMSNWFLIFDNVEKLTDIQKYFPQDTHTWGTGKIILTSRDYNLQNSPHVDHALFIKELNPFQQLSLFAKIMGQGTTEPFAADQYSEAKQFLEKIPPFPLDISVAAYYLKVANIPYKEYIENIKKYKNGFDMVQSSILKEFGSYSKTRYGIITLSLQEIITASKDFADLLLFISLIDGQDIPRDLLEKYKNNIIVDNFIYHLKKYSLIMNEPRSPTSPLSTLSLHNSTQDIIRAYLDQELLSEKGNQLLDPIGNVLDDYVDQVIEQEDFPKMKIMAGHLEKFLEQRHLLSDLYIGFLESKLGCIYYFLNDDKSRKILEKSFNVLNTKKLDLLSSKDKSRLARSLLHIGIVYTELRLDKEAEELFKKTIDIYRKEDVKNDADLSWALVHLGNLHRKNEDYEEARNYLEESIRLNTLYGFDKKRRARTLALLGSVYRGLGFYQNALKSLKESLTLYSKNFANDHFRVGWLLTQLANVYRSLGEGQTAKQLLEKALEIFKKHLPEGHVDMGFLLSYLGNCYREVGEYEKSSLYLEESIKIHRKHFPETHLRIGWGLFNLASTCKAMGKEQEAQKLFEKALKIYSAHCRKENLLTARLLRDMAVIYIDKNQFDIAEKFVKRSLKILHIHNHAEVYKSLETLGDIFLKKSQHAFQSQNKPESQQLKNLAIDNFNLALKVAEQQFRKSSHHVAKIRSKIKDIKQ